MHTLLPQDLQARRSDDIFGGSDRMKLLLAAARILVLDDEEPNVILLTSLLRRAGFNYVTGFTDSRQFEARFEASAPDLVILDVHMPHRDGFSILESLEPWIKTQHLPVLFITGDISVDVRVRALALGARDFVTKPFDLAEISLRVHNLLETRLLYQDIRKQNRTLLDAVHGRTQELEEARVEMLTRLAIAAEYRDDSTGRHTERVGDLAAQLGGAMGMSADSTEVLRRAARLHDVGKIGIPDALLLKPTRLTDEEMLVIRTHTTIGAHILGGSGAPVLQMAETIALTHHEHWNGKGYPRQLVGEMIPLPGRLVAVADAFDALTNDRPYRRAGSTPDAIVEIRRCERQQFDPRVVDALEKVVKA